MWIYNVLAVSDPSCLFLAHLQTNSSNVLTQVVALVFLIFVTDGIIFL